MPDLTATAYPWLKSLHVLSAILWMGAQILLPLLLTAQRLAPHRSAQAEVLLQVQRQLIRCIMNPAMIAAFVFGALLGAALINASGTIPVWLVLKLSLVVVLAALHGKLLRQFWRARDGLAPWPARGYRLVQWLHFGLLAGTVALAVIKPLQR